jgi:hypothetical protein
VSISATSTYVGPLIETGGTLSCPGKAGFSDHYMISVLEQIERAHISDHLLLSRHMLGGGVTPWEVEYLWEVE